MRFPAIVAVIMMIVVTASAQIPSQMSYQGYLTDSIGNPITNTIFPMLFRICDDSTGTNTLWQTDGIVLIDVNEGYFTHLLGSSIPLPDSISNFTDLWLGITAGEDSEMPLIKIVSTGYSYKSLESDHSQAAEHAVHSDIASYAANADHSNTTDYAIDSDMLDGLNADAFSDTSHGHLVPDTVNFAFRSDTANVALGFVSLNVPIGAVLPWLKTFPNTPLLPGNFVECNGQVLDDSSSVYDGQTIPNLNGEQRFLVGNNSSGGAGGTSAHYGLSLKNGTSGGHVMYNLIDGQQSGRIMHNGTWTDVAATDHRLNDFDNRPPYYEVVWIMRIR
jgi:hypothetical protein